MKRKVLIIEDDPGITEAVRIAFGFYWPEAELVAATHGRQGIELARGGGIYAIILDLGLPDMDGFEVLEKVRVFASMPVIICTANSADETIARAFALQVDDYITKPFKQKDLIGSVKSHVES